MVVLDSSMVPHPTAGKVKNDAKKHGDRNGAERVNLDHSRPARRAGRKPWLGHQRNVVVGESGPVGL